MKKILAGLLLLTTLSSYADFSGFVDDVKGTFSRSTSYEGVYELKDNRANGEMVTSGKLAQTIWARAVSDLGEPYVTTDTSQLTGEEFSEQKISYRGWKCKKQKLNTIRDNIANFAANKFHNLEGNLICKKKIFND